MILAPLVFLVGSPSVSAASYKCLHYTGDNIKGDGTTTYGGVKASKTWDDWIWRGPTFRCPTSSTSCTYSWGQTKSTKYSFGLMGMSGIQGSPSTLLAQLWPSLSRTSDYTTSFTYTTTMRAGQYAQPIQVIVRRWHRWYVKDYWHYDSSAGSCTNRAGSDYRPYVQIHEPATVTADPEESRYNTYYQHE